MSAVQDASRAGEVTKRNAACHCGFHARRGACLVRTTKQGISDEMTQQAMPYRGYRSIRARQMMPVMRKSESKTKEGGLAAALLLAALGKPSPR
jgi:hypothetical protein